MGEIAIKSHASGKKHIAAVKLTEKVESVSDFFGESSDAQKPTSQIPSSSYFSTVRSAVQDSLIVAKLQFFVSTSSILMPYLQKFQANAPLPIYD